MNDIYYLQLLNKKRLTGKDLLALARLSYRNINEWEKRGVFPRLDREKARWRRLSGLEVLALRIVSSLRADFGTPLGMQRGLLDWMLGDNPGNMEGDLLQLASEILLFEGKVEAPGNEDNASQVNGRVHTHKDGRRPPKIRREEAKNSSNARATDLNWETILRKRQLIIDAAVPLLVERGWQDQEAVQFSTDFYQLFADSERPVKPWLKLQDLHEQATRAQDEAAKRALFLLFSAILPPVQLLALMMRGLPVVLVTDLSTHRFCDEFAYVDYARSGLLPRPSMTIRMNEHVNAILSRLGQEVLPLRYSISDFKAHPSPSISENEHYILRQLRQRDFTSMLIEHIRDGYRVEVTRDLPPDRLVQIREIVQSKDWQSVIIKCADGKVQRFCQVESVKI